MEVLVRLQEEVRLPPVELAHLSNAVARLFEVYQSGALALQKLKTGGTQRVIVQHQQQVNVGQGGQALVAGAVRLGSRKPGGVRELARDR